MAEDTPYDPYVPRSGEPQAGGQNKTDMLREVRLSTAPFVFHQYFVTIVPAISSSGEAIYAREDIVMCASRSSLPCLYYPAEVLFDPHQNCARLEY